MIPARIGSERLKKEPDKYRWKTITTLCNRLSQELWDIRWNIRKWG